MLVLAGVAVGFTPFVPDVSIQPDIVLLGLLPLLVFHAAYKSSPRAILAEASTIGLLATGLVVATAIGVAAVAHVAAGLSWSLALVLGTAVGPTDATIGARIAGRLGLSRRLVTILEGEGLLNDTTALVLYAVAVAAVASGRPLHASSLGLLAFSAAAASGIGLAVGALGRLVRRRLDDPPMEIVLSLLLAYGAFLPAQAIGASGVLAAVVAGLYLGWYDPDVATARSRLQGSMFWDALVFLIEAVLFTEVGLSLHAFAKDHDGHVGRLVISGAAVAATVIVVRVGWVFLVSRLPGPLRRLARAGRLGPRHRQEQLLLSWSGMRGAITLAAVLAIPRATMRGVPIARRADLIYLAFAVIFATLVGQGLTLPILARRFGPAAGPQPPENEREARAELARVALDELEREIASGGLGDGVTEPVRAQLERRINRIERSFGEYERVVDEYALERSLRLKLVRAQRQRLVQLRNDRRVTTATLREIERDLDLEETQLSRQP